MEFFIEVQQINVLWSSSRQCIHSDGSVTSFWSLMIWRKN